MGWILDPLRAQGYATVKLSQEEWGLVDALFARSRDFFGRESKYKESFKVYPMPGGYLTPFPGTYEIFELRRGLMRCPKELAGEAFGAFQLLERLALRVCAEIGRDIGADLVSMPSEQSPAMRCIHYDRPYDSRGAQDQLEAPLQVPGMGAVVRIVGLHGADATLNGAKGIVESVDAGSVVVTLDASVPQAAIAARGASRSVRVALTSLRLINSDAPGMYAAHSDSSLVTVAPRCSIAGLEAKDLHTGEWFRIEERMQANECLVFVGDPLDYASSHRYPALMHRPAVPCGAMARTMACNGSTELSRISTPFFLYPDDQALLAPRGLPSMLFDSLHGNLDKCRDRVPWKRRSCYYSDLVYSEES